MRGGVACESRRAFLTLESCFGDSRQIYREAVEARKQRNYVSSLNSSGLITMKRYHGRVPPMIVPAATRAKVLCSAGRHFNSKAWESLDLISFFGRIDEWSLLTYPHLGQHKETSK